MTQLVSFILRLILVLDLIRKMAGGDIDPRCMSRKRVREKGLAWDVGLVYSFLTGTGPLACLSLFPVADVDKL